MSNKDKRSTVWLTYVKAGKKTNVQVPVVTRFKLFWSGWECDSIGYVVELEGKPVLACGSSLYVKPLSVEDAQENLKDLMQGIADLQEAINKVQQTKENQ